MFYIIGGLVSLFAMAFYLMAVALIWAVGIAVTAIGYVVIAAIEYFTDKEPPKPTYAKYYKQFEVNLKDNL